MGLFDIFSRPTGKSSSAVFVDIGTSRVAGACVEFDESKTPLLVYATELPIEAHEGEATEVAMLRTLKTLGETLIRDGGPALVRAGGSAAPALVLVSVGAPWQETQVHTEHFEEAEPFVFTEKLVSKRLKEKRVDESDKKLVDESIVGTILNGYETKDPYGKKASRASVIVLTSLIERSVAGSIITTLERLYHTKHILPIAGSSLRYQSIRALYPHERDALILDATNQDMSSISLVRKGLIVSLVHADHAPDPATWVGTITDELTEIAKSYPLPRTIFLLAREQEVNGLREKLDSAHFTSLWLSDNPPKVVPILRSQLTTSVRQTLDTPVDTVSLLMAIFYQNRKGHLEEGI
jgi:hypothetical protein